MDEEVIGTTLASTKEINDIIKKAYNKSSYSIEGKSHSNEKYDYDNDNMTHDLRRFVEEVEKATINIKDNAIEIVNTFEDVIGNDVIRNKKISLFLRFRLRRQNVTIEEEKVSSMCNNYWKDCWNQQCRQHQKLWRQWLNIQKKNYDTQNTTKGKIERRGTSIALRINNLSLIKQGKRKAPQWKTHWRSAMLQQELYNKWTQQVTHVPFARQYD